MKSFLRDIVTTLVLALVLFFALQATLQSFIVVGHSMEPSFYEEQRLIVNRIAYRFQAVDRGDVVVFHAPNNQRGDYIKRIIALPYESVEIKEGKVYIHRDGEVFQLDEPYIGVPPRYDFRSGTIQEGEYFVLGDNRNNSNDSHNGWMVEDKDIIGRAWISIWPPEQWGLAPNYSLSEPVASAAK